MRGCYSCSDSAWEASGILYVCMPPFVYKQGLCAARVDVGHATPTSSSPAAAVPRAECVASSPCPPCFSDEGGAWRVHFKLSAQLIYLEDTSQIHQALRAARPSDLAAGSQPARVSIPRTARPWLSRGQQLPMCSSYPQRYQNYHVEVVRASRDDHLRDAQLGLPCHSLDRGSLGAQVLGFRGLCASSKTKSMLPGSEELR